MCSVSESAPSKTQKFSLERGTRAGVNMIPRPWGLGSVTALPFPEFVFSHDGSRWWLCGEGVLGQPPVLDPGSGTIFVARSCQSVSLGSQGVWL